MPIIKTIQGDILDCKEDIIVQQSNCLSISTYGLSKIIKEKLKVDPYGQRRRVGRMNFAIESDQDIPGTIRVIESPVSDKKVACLFAQWSTGKANRKNPNHPDAISDRINYFRECIEQLDNYCNEHNITQVAVPFGIGCGLAGGNWSTYESLLNEAKTKIVLYKL